jgi:hypothetical protein
MDVYKNKLSLMITPLDYPKKKRWEIILNLALIVIDHHHALDSITC